MTDRIRQRIETLEAQYREVVMQRDAAQRTLNETTTALIHLEGALVVLRDLLVPQEVPLGEEVKVADGG